MLLLELVKVINVQKIQQSKLNKDTIFVYYDNGVIYTNISEHPAPFPLSIKINYSNNSLEFYPMDDRSDFRFIYKLQQFLSDLLKSNLIKSNWKIKISTGGMNKYIGSAVDDILKYDSSMVKKIPWAFHGTTDLYVRTIKKYGLMPINQLLKLGIELDTNFDKFYTAESGDNIYLSMDVEVAKYYANNAADQTGGNPIIVVFKDLDVNNINADDDIINNVGFVQFLNKISNMGSGYNHYKDSIKANSQFRVKGRISPNLIYKIIKV